MSRDAAPPAAVSVWQARAWLAAGLIALALVAFWALHTARLELWEQHVVAETATAWGLNACVVLGLGGLVGVARPIFARLGARRLLQVLAVGVAAWLLAGLAPRTHRIFFDEHIYMQIGQTYAHTGRLSTASYANAEHGLFQWHSGLLNKQPQGWPYVYGQAARIFGTSARLGQEINRLAVGGTAALLCLALMLSPWRLPAAAPVATGLAWALTPLVPWWSRTAAVEPTSAATVVAAFCAAMVYTCLRGSAPVRGRPAAGALLAAATAFAGYFRPESLLVFPLVVAVLWAEEDNFVHDLVAWGALAFALALVLPNLAQLWSVRGEDWGATDGKRFNPEVFGKNLRANLGYFFLGRYFPVAGTALALIGFAWLLAQARSATVVLAVWFLPAWGVFVLFYAGGYYYGASNRYALISAAPVAVAVGIGASALLAWSRTRPVRLGLIASLAALSWSRALAFVPHLGREAIEVQEEVQFVARQARSLPAGSLVISQVPTMWLVEGRNSAAWFEVERLARDNLRELANQYPGGVYWHYGFWEHAEPDRADHAAHVLVEFGAEEVARFTSHAMNFAIFRLDSPEGLSRFGGPPPRYPARREGELENALRRARENATATNADSSAP